MRRSAYALPKSVHVSGLIREATSELLSEMVSIRKCENCLSYAPDNSILTHTDIKLLTRRHYVALRKDKNTKIFHSKSEKKGSDGKDDVEVRAPFVVALISH